MENLLKTKKIALVLSGGGFKGYFQVGVLDYLHEQGLHFDYISGVSVGALNGSFVAMNKFNELKSLWAGVLSKGYTEIYTSDYLDMVEGKMTPNYDKIWNKVKPKASFFSLLGKLASKNGRDSLIKELIGNALKIKSVADNKPLQDKLIQFVNIDDFKVPFDTGFVSLTSGEYVSASPEEFDNSEDFALAIAASATMPIVWSPVPVIHTKTDTYLNSVDGGIRNISPLGDAVDFIVNDESSNSEWTILIVNCTSGKIEKLVNSELNIASIAGRVFDDIVLNEIFNDDIREFLNTNEYAKQVDKPLLNRNGKKINFFNTVIIQPNEFELGDTLDSSKETLYARYELGRKLAQEALTQHGVF